MSICGYSHAEEMPGAFSCIRANAHATGIAKAINMQFFFMSIVNALYIHVILRAGLFLSHQIVDAYVVHEELVSCGGSCIRSIRSDA